MTIKLTSPVDGSIYAEREPLSQERALEAVARAKAAQKDWGARPLSERINLVRAGLNDLNQRSEQAVEELAWQMGRPTRYGGEFGGVDERASHMADIAETALADTVIEDSPAFRRRISRVPHGVVFVIAPWNYPYLTAINTVAPALIAGNAVVLKHATQTLLAGERMVAAFRMAGLPENLFQNVFLDHEIPDPCDKRHKNPGRFQIHLAHKSYRLNH